MPHDKIYVYFTEKFLILALKHQRSDVTLQIRAWAESKQNFPGKFTGSTGVNALKADQLGPDDPRFNAWAKKVCLFTIYDFFKNMYHICTT